MINSVVMIGRLTKDVELRKTQNGKSVTSFALAVNRTGAQDGQQDCDYINCIAWGKTADIMAQYLNKGSLIGIEGRIQTRTYQKDNRNVYVTEVLVNTLHFLETKKQQTQKPVQQPVQQPTQQTQPFDDNEFPF